MMKLEENGITFRDTLTRETEREIDREGELKESKKKLKISWKCFQTHTHGERDWTRLRENFVR